MSSTEQPAERILEENTVDDKQKIADEEKEKMINNKQKDEVIKGAEFEKKKKAVEDAVMEGDKRRIPIGGIKIPGFLKSTKSKEKNKEGGETEENADLLEQPAVEVKVDEEKETKSGVASRLPILDKFSNINVPFLKRKKSQQQGTSDENNGTEEPPPRKPNLINAIRLPIANLVPRRNKNKDEEAGPKAGLASMETLDEDHKLGSDDGMENVNLDTSVDIDEKADLDDGEKPWSITDWERNWALIKKYKVASASVFIFIILLFALIITVLFGPRVPTHAPIIDGKYISAVTSCGMVEGLVDRNAFIFRGIPYAKAPIGELRFRKPEPMLLHDCWEGTLKAHNRSSTCWQMYSNGSIDGSEDCLTLEIITPKVGYDSPLPVIFVIGTESLLGGWPGDIDPNPDLTRAKEVVIVRPSFRLATLGFLGARPLSQTSYPRSSGNYGLADLIQALKWTRLNIQHFGGDSKSITVFGHRGGGTLAAALTTILKPEKLFDRVWISSGSAVFPNGTLLDAEAQAESYLQAVSCDKGNETTQAECLRKLDVEELLDAIPEEWRRPDVGSLPKGEVKGRQWLVMDGIYLRLNAYEVWSKNLSVQVVIGTTQHAEITQEWYEERKNWTSDRVMAEFRNSQIGFEGITDKILEMYNNTVQGLAQVISDISTVCPLYNMHKSIAFSRFYLVEQPSDTSGITYKGDDVLAIIGPYPYDLSPSNRRYLTAMRHMFYRFVQLGIPPENKLTSVQQDPLKMDRFEIEKRCAIWAHAGFSKFARLD